MFRVCLHPRGQTFSQARWTDGVVLRLVDGDLGLGDGLCVGGNGW